MSEMATLKAQLLGAVAALDALEEAIAEAEGAAGGKDIPRQAWNEFTHMLKIVGLQGGMPAVETGTVDGEEIEFQAYTVSPGQKDYQHIMRGATCAAGLYWPRVMGYSPTVRKHRRGKVIEEPRRMFNAKEMTGPWDIVDAKDPADAAVLALQNYDLSKGSLTTNPDTWPEPYRTIFMASHTAADFDNLPREVRPQLTR